MTCQLIGQVMTIRHTASAIMVPVNPVLNSAYLSHEHRYHLGGSRYSTLWFRYSLNEHTMFHHCQKRGVIWKKWTRVFKATLIYGKKKYYMYSPEHTSWEIPTLFYQAVKGDQMLVWRKWRFTMQFHYLYFPLRYEELQHYLQFCSEWASIVYIYGRVEHIYTLY